MTKFEVESNRAKILYCIDFLMRSLNDEDELDVWFSLGVPDGTLEEAGDLHPTHWHPYLDMVEDEDEWESFVSLFVFALARQAFGNIHALQNVVSHPKGVFGLTNSKLITEDRP